MTAFETYLRLLLELASLMEEERDDMEADIIRDQMDDPWWQLTKEEQHRLDVISEALYRMDKIPSYEDLQKYLILL